MARHDDDPVTAAMNAVIDAMDTEPDAFTHEAAVQGLRRVEW